MRSDLPNQLAVLRGTLREVNAEWRALVSESGNAAKLSRLADLRTQRLALMTRIFEIERSQRRTG